MVGEVNDDVQNPEQLLSQPQADEQQQDERLFSKREMSDVAKRERERAYEKGKREALAELERQKAQQPANNNGFQANPLSQNAMSQDDIKQLIAQEAPALLQKHIADAETHAKTKNIVDSFVNKIDAARERLPDLETQLNDLDFSTFAPIVTLANDMENTADIMHELIQNPMKMGNMLSLMHNQPKMAARAMYELSNSIKQNQKALQDNQYANEPNEQFRSSVRNNGKDDASMTVSDFMKIYRG